MTTPPNIVRRFNSFKISFRKGGKKAGDYLVDVNGVQVKDQDIFKSLFKIKSQEEVIIFLKFLWEIGKLKYQEYEERVFTKINARAFDAETKTYLYVIWHRLIIDDINYPPPIFNGRKRGLGQVYILLAKKFGFELPDEVKSIPEEVYLLGFPEGLKEKIEKETWSEIYELYRKFVETDK